MLVYPTTILSVLLVVLSVLAPAYAGSPPEPRTIAGRGFRIQLPKGTTVVSSLPVGKANYAPYIKWGRRPWSPGFLTETQNANVLFVSYFTAKDLSRLGKVNGGLYTLPYYGDTINIHHAEIKVYQTQTGRFPAIIRYDVQDDDGVFSFVASIDRYNNANYDSDIIDFITALKSFVPTKTKP